MAICPTLAAPTRNTIPMIDFLIPETHVTYDLTKKNGTNNPGGGIAVKYARVIEAAEPYWEAKRVSETEEITSDIVLVDWQWFVNRDREEIIEATKAFLQLDVRLKILYGSDLTIIKAPRKIRELVLEGGHGRSGVDIVTHNSEYQRNLYKAAGIHDSTLLIDPTPEHLFYPAEKHNRVIAIGQVGWYKRTDLVIKTFHKLTLKGIETCYVGGKNTWGDNVPTAQDVELHEQLKDLADIFIENASTTETAYWTNTSKYYIHVSHHDCSNQAGQENMMAGNLIYGLTHPINRERYGWVHDTTQEIADSITKTTDFEKESKTTRKVARRKYSYATWRHQLGTLLHL